MQSNLNDALDALQTGGKRQKIHDAQMVFKLPGAVKGLVEAYAKSEGMSEGAVQRQALAEFFERRGYGSHE